MHPLTEIVGKLVKPTRDRYQPLLKPVTPGENSRDARDDRFAVSSQLVAGQAVLLVDDTWTTGAHAQSAASALRLAGAGPVAILAIGRHFAIPEREEYIASARDYLNRSKALKWDWSRCCLCDDR
jgi:adenine/guanine phosphoribosyltransferase-like PRPP-binding protein